MNHNDAILTLLAELRINLADCDAQIAALKEENQRLREGATSGEQEKDDDDLR